MAKNKKPNFTPEQVDFIASLMRTGLCYCGDERDICVHQALAPVIAICDALDIGLLVETEDSEGVRTGEIHRVLYCGVCMKESMMMGCAAENNRFVCDRCNAGGIS